MEDDMGEMKLSITIFYKFMITYECQQSILNAKINSLILSRMHELTIQIQRQFIVANLLGTKVKMEKDCLDSKRKRRKYNFIYSKIVKILLQMSDHPLSSSAISVKTSQNKKKMLKKKLSKIPKLKPQIMNCNFLIKR